MDESAANASPGDAARANAGDAAAATLPAPRTGVRARAGTIARRTWVIARRAARRPRSRTTTTTVAPATGAATKPAPSSLRRWGAAGVFVLIVVGTTIGLVGLALSQERPTWWVSVDPKDPVVREIAERLENAVVTHLTQARSARDEGDPDAPWTVRISAEHVNAWLNARLPTWMENREDVEFEWPESLQELQIDFRDGLIHVGAKVSAAKRVEPDTRSGNYFSATIEPQFKPDGSLWMPARRVAIGRLSLPASWMLSEPEEVAADEKVPDEIADLPETRQVLAAFAGRRAVMVDPTIRLGDGRKVRVLGMTAADGKLSITCQTIVREPARADAGDHEPSLR